MAAFLRGQPFYTAIWISKEKNNTSSTKCSTAQLNINILHCENNLHMNLYINQLTYLSKYIKSRKNRCKSISVDLP